MSTDVRYSAVWRELTGRGETLDDPRSWRERLLDVMLLAAFVLGLVTALPGLVAALPQRDWTVVGVDGVALGYLGVLTFARKLPYTLRAWGFLTLVFVLGGWFLATVGAVSQVYLMAVPVLAALLLGFRPAIGALVVNALTVYFIGYRFAPGVVIPRYADAPELQWLLISLNLTFLSAVITAGVSYLLRRLETALAEQRRVTAAIEQAGDAILLGAPDGRVRYANTSARRLFEAHPGAPSEERPPAPLLQTLVEPLRGGPEGDTPLASVLPWEGEVELPDGNGATHQFRVSVSPLHENGEDITGFVAVLQDVTRERRMEARVRRGERLEALGILAGGVAHDFNNIVGSILGLVDDVRSRAPSPAIAMSLDAMVTACLRARDVVRQMMVFARKTPFERRPVAMRSMVEEALALVRAGTPSRIAVRSRLESSASVLAGEAEIHQLLMNLCTNAVQAMDTERGGTLTIGLTDHAPPDLQNVDSDAPDQDSDGYVCLSVTDDGRGIPPEDLARVFDPFFTTRAATQGTGLGLATVYGIVRSMGGEIRVYSELGSGTTFRIYLPHASREAAALVGARVDEQAPHEGHVLHVLLVDDEEVLRRMTSRTLRRLGHEVTEAHDGREALNLLREDPDLFDLVLTDLTMPRMGGAELVRRVRELGFGLPFIVASGFADTPEGRALDRTDGVTFLSKPFTRSELSRATREATPGPRGAEEAS